MKKPVLFQKFKSLSAKEKRRTIIKYGVLCIFVFLALFLCGESLMPGSVSSEHSNTVGELIDFSVNVPVEPTSLTLTSSANGQTDVTVGSHLTLLPVFTPSNATYKQVEWSVSDERVASVEGSVVTFLSEGAVTVTATSKYNSSLKDSLTFRVARIPVESISISQIPDLTVGQSINLAVSVLPSNATNRKYELSYVGDCIKLSGRVLTATKPGSATITATALDNGASCSVTVTVSHKPVTSLSFYHEGAPTTELSLRQGQSADLTTVYSPHDSTNAFFAWSHEGEISLEFSSSYSVTVTATTIGSATVTATLETDDSISATIIINTQAGDIAPPDTVTALVGGEMTLLLNEKRSVEFEEITLGGGNAYAQYEYEVTSGTDVIRVNQLGLITPKKIGTATVVVTLLGSDIFTTVTVNVIDLFIDELSLKLPSSIVYVGREYSLSCSFAPSSATATSLTWSVSNSEIASISQAGVIKFNSPGSVTVTVTAQGGAFVSAAISARNALEISDVTCKGFAAFSGFSDKMATATIARNGCAQLNVVFASNATYKEYTVSSSDQKVLSVDGDTLTALKPGKSTVTVYCHDGDENTTPIVYTVEVTVQSQKLSTVVNNWMYKIRKGLGHFAAFFVLGIFATLTFALFINRKWLGAIFTIISGFSIASLTEFLQMLAPGRGPSFADVLLDFYGFIIATAATLFAFFVIIAIKKRKSVAADNSAQLSAANEQSEPDNTDISV
ncbi:MAG: VanZ family protein [Clostridia bacterium]|nr:VanZ family protein [Clostridia bacterium]